jgi:hypothetical protein
MKLGQGNPRDQLRVIAGALEGNALNLEVGIGDQERLAENLRTLAECVKHVAEHLRGVQWSARLKGGQRIFFTDYPITQLGDSPRKEAPVRECRIFKYDGNKYITILVGNVLTEVKRGYVYSREGRCGDAPPATDAELREVISWEER